MGKLSKGDRVIYINRRTHTMVRLGKSFSYTEEIVLRGVWDGEKAELYETYDPRKLKTIVRNENWLIKDNKHC